MDIWVLIISMVVIFFSGLIQGVTSFGFCLVALPLLSIMLPLKLIVPVLSIFSLIINSIILFSVRKSVNFRKISVLIISGIIATPIGANLLLVVNDTYLRLAVGVIIVALSVLLFFNVSFKVKKPNIAYIPVGFTSGLLGGSLSLSGPPIVLFLNNLGVKKDVFKATLTAYFWVLNIITMVTYYYKGLLTSMVITTSLKLLPALFLAVFIGLKISKSIDESFFKKLTLMLMIVMGVIAIVTSI